MAEDYEYERTATREEAAAVLHELADGLAAGTLRFGPDEEPIDVEVPGTVDLELELETESDRRGVEVELEWSTATDTEASGEASDSEAVETGSGESVEDGEGTTEEPGAAGEDLVETVPVESGGSLESLARFEVYRDRGGEWRWRLRHRNGNVIATSGEGYTRKANAVKGLRSVMRNSPAADVVEE